MSATLKLVREGVETILLRRISARSECLDWPPILNRRHLEHVLRVDTDHYNRQRPHRALALRPPDPLAQAPLPASAEIGRHDRSRSSGVGHSPSSA